MAHKEKHKFVIYVTTSFISHTTQNFCAVGVAVGFPTNLVGAPMSRVGTKASSVIALVRTSGSCSWYSTIWSTSNLLEPTLCRTYTASNRCKQYLEWHVSARGFPVELP